MNHYSPTDIVLILTAIFTGICSVIAAVKSNAGARDSKSNGDKLDAAKDTLDKQDTKLETIHTVSNGNLSRALAKVDELTVKLESAMVENIRLREDIADFNKRKRTP